MMTLSSDQTFGDLFRSEGVPRPISRCAAPRDLTAVNINGDSVVRLAPTSVQIYETPACLRATFAAVCGFLLSRERCLGVGRSGLLRISHACVICL